MADERSEPTGPLRCGAAQVDITPAPGTQLAGNVGIRQPAHSVLDPLYAKAVVFEQDGRKVCVLGLDVTFIARQHTTQIRRAAADRFGFDPQAVMVVATQTHSAPPIGAFLLDDAFPLPDAFQWLRLGDAVYSRWATERAIEAIGQANDALRPVRIGVGSAIKDGLAFNRRAVRRDGTVGMPFPYPSTQHPLGLVDYRYMEGPTDPEVGVLCAQDASMNRVGMLLHFTCHPVNVFFYRGRGFKAQVSADWPGAWAHAMRAAHGEGCVGLVLNGACGNINPWPPFEPDFVPDHRRMGAALGETAERVIGTLAFTERATLDGRIRTVPVPLRQVDAHTLAQDRAAISEHPDPVVTGEDPDRVDGRWFRSAMRVCLDMQRQAEPEMPCEVQVVRVGDTALVGLPGEPFVEGQLRIKMGSPTYPTYVAHASAHFAGYIPTREAFAHGGHEVATSSWACLVPEALDVISDNAIDLMNQMFGAH